MNAPVVSEHGALLEGIDKASEAVESAHVDAGLCNSYQGDRSQALLQGAAAILRLARQHARDGQRREEALTEQ